MSGRYRFNLASDDPKRRLPEKVIVGIKSTETPAHVLLKFLGFVLFYRERLEIEKNLHRDSLQYVPDLVQLDYTLRPVFWGECGDCTVEKLNRLAVKVPEAQIWILKKSIAEAEILQRQMIKNRLRRNRYHLVGLDQEMFDELLSLLQMRNEFYWLCGEFNPPNLQFDFNGIWFDVGFSWLRV